MSVGLREEPAAAPVACTGLRVEIAPEVADYRCKTSESVVVGGGRRLRVQSAGYCGEAEITVVVTNCSSERLVVQKIRASVDDEAVSEYWVYDVLIQGGASRQRVLVGRTAGALTVDVELVAADDSVRHVTASGRVRGVLTHIVN